MSTWLSSCLALNLLDLIIQQNASWGSRKTTHSMSARLPASDLPSFRGKVLFPCSRRTKATWKPATSTTCVPKSLWLRNRIQHHNYRMIKNLPLVSATQHSPKQCAEARDIPRHYHRNQSDYSKKRLGPAFGSTGPPFHRPLCAICCLCACSFSSGCLRWLHGCCQTCPHDRRRHPPPFAVKPFFFVWCTCSSLLLPSPDIVHTAC